MALVVLIVTLERGVMQYGYENIKLDAEKFRNYFRTRKRLKALKQSFAVSMLSYCEIKTSTS